MRQAVERHEVVLAGGVNLDVLDQDHLVVAELERRRQDVGRVLTQAAEHLRVGAGEPRRGVAQAFAVGVLADGDEQLADGGLDPRMVERPADVLGEIGLGDQRVSSRRHAPRRATPRAARPAHGAVAGAVGRHGLDAPWPERRPGPRSDGLRGGRAGPRRPAAHAYAPARRPRRPPPCRASPSRAARATRSSRTSRFSTRMSNASWCAVSMRRRTSSSTWPATSSE